MKTLKIIGTIIITFLLTNCNSMDDNYKGYLKDVQIYSPCVTNLTVVSGLKVATLSWKNPIGNIAVKNIIHLQDSVITLDGLVETYQLKNLEIKGYQISVYTVDKFNNFSVPASITIFPNGE